MGNILKNIACNGATGAWDSSGNVMIKDNLTMLGANPNTWSPQTSNLGLVKKGVKAEKFKHKHNRLDDNSLTCDSMGNCMLKDRLRRICDICLIDAFHESDCKQLCS